ncbi:cupin domain-containing protein [Microseira wollei]|uniref:Cupin 4 family protein, putative n=1 Tax=Microseira wollei NIES-4236 TaxID=2530354 RepID=A0AAV3X467_9CYAN|nr:cupin domain-containing protein [Microseira wollei]GET35385.1 cupin 4 family protein, putative [Microseira wollei NIES-4236]
MTSTDFDFAKAIAPIQVDTFFDEYWEKRPLVVSRQTPDYYTNLLTMADIDLIIYSLGPDWKTLRLVKQGGFFAHNFMHPDGSANIVQLYNAYEQGYSIILLDLHKRWMPLSAFARELECFLNHPVGINLYLTPKNSQAFVPHFDDHDVLILQIEGTKNWRIYEPIVELPNKEFAGGEQSLPKEQLPPVVADICLAPGDMLYLPRGYGHNVSTSNCSSLHLTVGIFIYTWSDLLSGMLRSLSKQDVAFRRALPPGFIRDSQIKNSLEAQFQEILQYLATQAKLESGIEKLTDSLLENMKNPLPDGYFRRIDHLSKINLETIVQKRKGTIFRIVTSENSLTVKYLSTKIEMSQKFAAALDYINTNSKFTIKELPLLNDDAKLELVQRMIGSGILTIVEERTVKDSGGWS